MPYHTIKTASVLAVVLLASGAAYAGSAMPTVPGTAVVVPVEHPGSAGHPTEGSDSQNFWTDQGLFDNSDDPSAASEAAPSGGDPEIQELKEEFPETNWPKR